MNLWRALVDAMRRRRTPRLSSADLDRLIAGGSPGPGQGGLAALLDAAKAPASAEELAGERAAVDAFVAAYRSAAPTGTPKRRSRVRIPSLARAATMKAVAGVAVLVVGGTAVAAQTGSLPRGVQDQAHDWFSGLGVPPPPPARTPEQQPSRAPSRGADPSTGPSAPPAGPGSAGPVPGPSAPVPPAAEARELCLAWRTANDEKPGKPLKAAELRALIAMAGDESDIADFCRPYLPGSSAPPPPAPDVIPSPAPPGNGEGNGNDGPRDEGGPKEKDKDKDKDKGKDRAGGNDPADAAVDGRAGPPG